MAFDIEGARKAGYSDGEIASFLGSQSGFDVDGAIKSGYEPSEIVSFLSEQEPKERGLFDTVKGAVTSAAGRLSDEAGQLRDEFFSGVDSAVAGIKTLNTGIQMRRLQETEAEAKRLEGRGQSVYARQMRNEAKSLQERVPVTVGEAAESQATAQRGSQMTTRPAVAKLNEAKTWGDAWNAFTEAPYDVIAGVTASSLPATLPGLVAAAVMGPAAGAVTLGMNSAAVEAGSSLGEFAREKGVDTTDAKALQAFFGDRQNLADAMTYAGKRAGIIGALDAASGGIAGKTLAPAVKSQIGRQAVNLPAQMGVQAGLGAAGEAGGQIATKGRIDQPGQVLAEAVGEFGGAPAEVLAFSKDARQSLRPTPKVDDILAAPDVDSAIQTATEVLALPAPSVNTGETILATERGTAGTANQFDALRRPTDIREAGGGMGRNADITDVEPKATAIQSDPAALFDRPAGDPLAPMLEDRRIRTDAIDAVQQEAEQRKATELDAIPELAAEQDTVAAALERAGALETPTAMQLALQRAKAPPAPAIEAAPVAEPVAPELPRVVERTPQMVAMPQKLAEQRAAANPALEIVRIRNQSGKFAYTVIPKAANVSPSVDDAGSVPAGVDGRSADVAGGESAGGPGYSGLRAAPVAGSSATADVAVGGGVGQPAAVVPNSGMNVPNEPAATWFGRRGDGYLTEGDARMAIPSRQRVEPDLSWQVEKMPTGKFRLAGYPSAAVESQDGNQQPQTEVSPVIPARDGPRVDAVSSQGAADPATGQPDGNTGGDADLQGTAPVLAQPAQVTQTPPLSGVPSSAPAESATSGTAEPTTAVIPVQPNALALTPRQFHDARLTAISHDSGSPISEVREMYDDEGGRADSDNQWVASVREAFKAGSELRRETLDKLEELRPGAVASFAHDYPDAKVPNGYQTPESRKVEKQRIEERRQDRRAAAAERAEKPETISALPAKPAEVSRYTGKYGKGMGHDAARLEASRLNRKNDGVTYTAEEHGDASLENPWAVVGRKKPLDHGELSIPNRTKNIDAELDRYKASQAKEQKAEAKEATAQRKTDKARAKELFEQLWPSMKDKMGGKFGEKQLRETLDSMVKWEPAKFIAVAEKFQRENADANPDQTPLFSREGAERYAVGKTLTKAERRTVLATLADVYKLKQADREQKGIGADGNERWGYVHSPELFEKSDITGAPVRYYVTLPDGRKAHPSELFPDYTQSDVDKALAEQQDAERQQRQNDESRLRILRSRVADSLGGANRIFNVQNPRRDYTPAILTNGTEYVRTAPEAAEADAKLLGGEWRVESPAPDSDGAKFAKGEASPSGLTPFEFTAAITKAFGPKVAERLESKGIVVPLSDQTSLPDNVVSLVRDNGIVYGFYDPVSDKTYAVLENLSPDMVKGLVLHEVGIHYGFEQMLGKEKYAQVIARVKMMGKAGNKQVIAARDKAKQNAAKESQVPEETLAYLVGDNPEMTLVQEVIARIKAFLFNTFGIGGKYLTANDMTALARAAVLHASRADPEARQRDFEAEPAFSRSQVTGKTLPQTWQAPDESKLDDFIYSLQDKYIDTKRALESIRQTIGAISDEINPYQREELYHKRAEFRTKEFLQNQMTPLLAEMQARGVDMSDFEEYLHNRHAERRNTQVAKVNPNMPDGGSGIKTADAQKYLAGLPADKRKSYEALAKRVAQITKDTRKLLVDSGLEKQTTIAAWEGAYGDEYVPLMREEMDDGTRGIGQGYSVRGSASKRAMGSNKPVADIIANIALQREKAITRAEKKRIGEALYGLVLTAPNPDFWYAVDPELNKNPSQIMATQMQLISLGLDPKDAESIAQETVTRYIDKNGQVAYRINPAMRGMDNVLAVRIDGEDKFVFFNTKDDRALRMVTALKNLDSDQLGTVMGTVAKMTRYFAAVNTQWNPVFGVTNFTRDVQTALLNLNSTPLKGHKADVMKHVLPALRGIYIDLRDHRAGKQPTSAYAQLFEEFMREGGGTGYRDMYANAQERTDAIVAELKAMKDGKALKLGKGILHWLSDYNEAMENAVRVAAYKVGKEQGLTNEQAASLAKNLTVNFNRKGQVALQAGALYAFFNAAVQGSARMGQTMFEGGKLSSTGRKILTGGILLGSMQAMLLAAAGFDDDEPPDFVRERALVIPIGGAKYIAIPMPLGFHVIPNLGRIPTEWAMGGFKNTTKRIAQLVGVFADAFNPIGSAGLSIQTLAPTVLDPLAALAENRDWTGKPIAKKDFNSLAPTAGHTRTKDTATPWARAISYGVNIATGGSDYKPGLVSPTPDQLDYLIGQVTGGVGRELGKVAQVSTSTLSGEELPMHKIPLVGRFVGTTEGQSAEASRFYNNLRELGEHKVEIDGLKKDRRGAEIGPYLRENKEARLVPLAEKVHREVSKLNNMKRDAIKAGASPERVKLIEMQITAKMRVLNNRVKQLEAQD